LHGDIGELERLSAWIEDCRQRIHPDVSHAIQLCLEEAVANVIMHGTAGDDRVAITVELSGRDAVVRLEDNSWQFDPTQAPPPPVAASFEEATVGLFGISLIRNFASGWSTNVETAEI
jgi:serine/threonine-protein kinase RsbW